MSINQQNLIRQSRNPYRTHGLTNLLYPSKDGSYRDLYRSGWLPSWFNQQWGGAYVGHELADSTTGQVYNFEPATGQIQDDGILSLLNASNYYESTGFKVSESFTLDSVWLKLYKVGNPTANLTVRIYTDSSGSPSTATGSAATLSCKLINSNPSGEWYHISGLNCALVAGTQYHIVITTSTTDASNYCVWKQTQSRKYPGGFVNSGTSTPAWTQYTSSSACFLIEAPTTSSTLRSGGMFDQKLSFNEGSPINQSRSLVQPLKNFFDGKEFTYIGAWNSLTKNKTFADFLYGLDHDRVVLRSNVTTGFPQVDVYDTLGVKRTVTGTVDVSTGNHQVGIHIRARGDGLDVIDLIVDGSVNITLTGLTLNFDPLFRDLGTAWVGGGFDLAPTWTQSMSFSTLPSLQGWTWTGTATEANAMSISGGKLYQNKSGYASTDTGYYIKATAGLNNATGWTVSWKNRSSNSTNTTWYGKNIVTVSDGTKTVSVLIEEYFLGAGSASADFYVQGDFKSQEHVFTFCGKGSDYYVFIDNKLVIDGTGKLTSATASNQIQFGDVSATAGENADVIWSYIKYYTGGITLPQATSGSLSESAYWSGDKTSYAIDLYNNGSFISAKRYCGLERNYVESIVQKETRVGTSISFSTTSSTLVPISDLEAFVIGSTIRSNSYAVGYNSAGGNATGYILFLNGTGVPGGCNPTTTTANYNVLFIADGTSFNKIGLHKIDVRLNVSGGTSTLGGVGTPIRTLTVESNS